jgi:hypothetical protein
MGKALAWPHHFRGDVRPLKTSLTHHCYCSVCTKPGKWAVMYLGVRGIKSGKWTVMYLGVRCIKSGKWAVMYLGVRGIKSGKWAVMYLGIRGFDFVSFHDFNSWLWNRPDSVVCFAFFILFSVVLSLFVWFYFKNLTENPTQYNFPLNDIAN